MVGRFACFVLRGRYPGVSEIRSQVSDALPIEHVAVMRAMQDVLDAMQPYTHTRARKRLGRCAEVMEQGLDLAPMNIRGKRLTEDGANPLCVFVAHGKRDRLPSPRGWD